MDPVNPWEEVDYETAHGLSRKWKLRRRSRPPYRDCRSEMFFLKMACDGTLCFAGNRSKMDLRSERKGFARFTDKASLSFWYNRKKNWHRDLSTHEAVAICNELTFQTSMNRKKKKENSWLNATPRSSKLAVIWTLASTYHNHFVSDAPAPFFTFRMFPENSDEQAWQLLVNFFRVFLIYLQKLLNIVGTDYFE